MSTMSASESNKSSKLRMITCGGCNAKLWVSGDLPPCSTMPCTKCGHPMVIPFHLRQFELRSIIGSGGMGTVYRALDRMLEREVAVKLIKKELAQDEKAVRSFMREARSIGALNHTNIIHVYTFDKHGDQLYLVMELADKGNMDQRIENEAHLPELDVLDIGVKIASALDLARKHDMLHRDIKPGNILFNADGEPKLIDFGLAGDAGEGTEDYHAVWGTPYYIAPEKLRREPETFLSDMYSLAGTLYHGLTGHVPFEAPTVDEVVAAHIEQPLTPPNHIQFEISQDTSNAIVQAMAKNPEERFQSYDEFIMQLTAARSKLLIKRYHTPEPPEPPPEQ